MALFKKSLQTLMLAGGLLAFGGTLKAQEKIAKYKDSVSTVLNAQQRQQNILNSLKQKAIVDKHTDASYIFDNLPVDLETIGVASRNNIFFAQPGKLIIGGGKEIFLRLKQLGYDPIQVANGVYEINVSGNIESKKTNLLNTLGTNQIVYKYVAYTAACPTFNDPEQLTSGRKAWLTDVQWLTNGVTNATTHDLDSVQSRKGMHVPSTTSNPNIVLNIFDGGFDVNNAEFQNRVIRRWNHTNNSINTTATDHGSSVADMAVATGNNGVGGVGLFDGPTRLFQVSSNGVTIIVADMYKALDSLISLSQQYPNQREINNFSLISGNDPVFYAKIQQLYAMNGNKQNFFQGAAGNQGVAGIVYPAAWNEFTARGATNITNAKPIWSGSNTGPEMVDHGYVNDGQGVWALQANGTYAAVSGTSFSTPLGSGTIANIVAQDTSRNNAQVRVILNKGAKDLGTTGPDQTYGNGWAKTGKSLLEQVVDHMPTSFNANMTPSYSFIPKYYNGLQTTNEKVYVNGSPIAIIPTINGQNEAVFALNFTTTNGFVNGNNVIKYEFNTPDGCLTPVYKSFTLSNVSTPTTPPTPDIRNVDPVECASNGTQTGKLQNPPVGATIAVTQDGNPLTYNTVDSTFQYPVGAAGAHTIRAQYTNAAGSALKDTLYNVNAAIATSISAPTAAPTLCVGQSTTVTAVYGNMGANPTFQWYRNGSSIPGATSSTYNYTNAAVGTQGFHVVITRDPNGCYTTGSPVSSTSPVTNVVVSPTPNAPIDNVVQPTCTVSTGSITVTNGQAGDQFSFNNGVSWQTSNVATGLATGTYQVLIRNSGGCISSSTAEVINAQPATPSAPIDNVVQPTCTVATGSITVTNGQTGDQFSFNNGATWQTSNVASGLTAGTYQVLRRNTSGCISAATAEVINAQPATPSAPTNSVVQPTCAVATGTITVTNGQAGDQYSFNNGVIWQTSNVATGLAAGTYQVLRRNTSGCISVATAEVINAAPGTPNAPVNSAVQPTCTVSTGSITVTNGQAGDQFSFDNGVTWQTSNVATGLAAGTYQVLRRNTAGCISAATAQVINAQPVTPATPIDNVVQPTCTVATGTITVTNGQAGDQYSFNNGVTWQTSNVATGLAAGTYQVLVRSSGGCISPVKAEVINAAPSTPNAPATSVVQPTCTVATGTITVTNGQTGDQYSFNNGVTWQTSNVATGLAAGTYQVLRRNTAGCISSATAEVVTSAPTAPVVGAITQVGNVLSVPTIAGATYQWQFSTTASGPFSVIAGANTNSYTITQSGFYKLVATGSNGCTGQSNAIQAVITSVPNVPEGNVRLYPNPLQNGQKLTIDSLPTSASKLSIRVYDAKGAHIVSMESQVVNRRAQLQLPFMAGGLYMIVIEDNRSGYKKVEKIIVN